MKRVTRQCVLVTGATGAVGPLVVRAFHDEGYAIRTLSMDPPVAGIWPDDVETRIGDVTDRTVVQSAMHGVDAVIHLAALLHIVNPPPEMREKYEHINVGGTKIVVDAAIEAGVKRVVLFSTIAVYGPSDGCVLNEMSPTHPETFYAKTKCAAEQVVLNAKRTDGLSLGTVLRFGAVYGSRIKGNYERLTRALAGNGFIPIGKGLNRRTLVYDKDVGKAAVLAVFHPAAAGRVFNVTDGEFHTLNEIIESICCALGRKQPCLSLPLRPILRLVGLVEKIWCFMRFMGTRFGISTISGHLPASFLAIRTTIDKYTEDIAVDGSLFQKEIGFVPQYDLKNGWEETIDDMLEKKSLNLSTIPMKRIFDLFISLCLVLLMLIPMAVIALSIRLSSQGPVLYWSDRVGRFNEIFKMPKFRTMRRNTPAVATHLLSNPGEYLTGIGSFLRKLSLDELPQLWCVLKGDMSLVGPRPALFNQDDLIALRTEKGIHRLVPGITGWAQINGRDDIPIPVKVDLDQYYLEQRSFTFDVQILLSTLFRVIHADNVSH